MANELSILRVKVANRWWLFAAAGASDARVVDTSAAELLLVSEWDDEWDSVLAQRPEWSRETADVEGVPRLIVGPSRKIQRYIAACARERPPDPEPPPPEPPDDRPAAPRRLPHLLDPRDMPRFREEGVWDPLGNDVAMHVAAWRSVALHVAAIAKLAHERRRAVAIALDLPTPMAVDTEALPWRSVVRVGESTSMHAPQPDEDAETAALDLMQRCLIAASATGSVEVMEEAAALTEVLGYVLATDNFSLGSLPPTLLGAELIGEQLAFMNDLGFIHGDAHTGNFAIQIENLSAVTFDLGNSGFANRPLTDFERAGELALLKSSLANFTAWEAAKAGYRAAAKGDVEGVFRLI